jgi:hypothetical protein
MARPQLKNLTFAASAITSLEAPVRTKIGWVFVGFWVIYRLVINSGIRFPFLPTKNFWGGNS